MAMCTAYAALLSADRLGAAPGSVTDGQGKDMADASIPATVTIAAVLADVDGTLVTKTKVLTPRAIEAIERLHERGVLFAITSGRPPRGMRMLVHPLEMRGLERVGRDESPAAPRPGAASRECQCRGVA